MAENTLKAKRYSQAIFEIAKERQGFAQWQVDLQKIALLAQNADFVSVMENPKFSFAEKSKLMGAQLTGISPMAMNLASILTTVGKFSLAAGIYSSYQRLLDNYKGIDQAEVTTALPLDEKEKLKLAERLSAINGKKIVMATHVDPEIIGGVIARVGGKIIDGSTRSQLAALKNELENAGMNA